MIRIVIAEDQEMLLQAIGSLLNMEDDMEVVGQAKNGEEAVRLVHQLHPDICIMDIEMPEMSGLDAADILMQAECKVIILTTFAQKGYLQRAIKADVRGYLVKDNSSEELVCSIRSIMGGKQIYSPELIDDTLNNDGIESEVVKLLACGQIENQVANHQRNKIEIMRNYFSTIMDKMK